MLEILGFIVLAGALPPGAALVCGLGRLFNAPRRALRSGCGDAAPMRSLERRVCLDGFRSEIVEPVGLAWLRGTALATAISTTLGAMFGGLGGALMLGFLALTSAVVLGLPALALALALARIAAGGAAALDEARLIRTARRDLGSGQISMVAATEVPPNPCSQPQGMS